MRVSAERALSEGQRRNMCITVRFRYSNIKVLALPVCWSVFQRRKFFLVATYLHHAHRKNRVDLVDKIVVIAWCDKKQLKELHDSFFSFFLAVI